MAKHSTRKGTADGKRRTLSERAKRAMKYHVPPLDVARLQREIHAQQREERS